MRYWWGWWGWRTGHKGRPDTGLPVASSRIGDHPGSWEPQDWDRRAERAYRVRLRTRALRSPRVAPVAAIPISAKATAVRVIALRTPTPHWRLPLSTHHQVIVAYSLAYGRETAMRQLSNDIAA